MSEVSTKPHGQPDQSGADQIVGLYRRHAHAWASDRGDKLTEAKWIDRFIDSIPSGAAVFDIGCGSGQPIGKYLIDKGCTVTGVDSSPEMIALASEHVRGGDWLVADMRKLSLTRTFDGILAWDSFFHLCHDDQRRMFPIFRKHAAPQAVLMFTSGIAHGVAIGKYAGEPLYHASLDPDEYTRVLNDHGFEILAHAVEDPDCGGRTVWLARLI
jgi:SAM-dependent methyltransferase